MEFLIAVQGWIRQSITANLNAFAATWDLVALALVLPLGVLFGAVHALTSGHGKTVLTPYLSARAWRSCVDSGWLARSP